MYRPLDVYDADLLNETPPRRERVAEIQDDETGELLCYADPAKADAICAAVNRARPPAVRAGRLQHRVRLSNGQVLLVEEGAETLHIATEDPGHEGEPDGYLCQIDVSGITVMTNSGDVNVTLVHRLQET